MFGTISDGSPNFRVDVTWQNMPEGMFKITPYRRSLILFVPAFANSAATETALNSETTSFRFNYGHTYLFYTLENVFLFKIEYYTGKWVDSDDDEGMQMGTASIYTPAIFLPLSSTPERSSFVYDFATKTIKQIP